MKYIKAALTKPGFHILLLFLPVVFFFLHGINQFTELIFSTSVLLLFFFYCCLAFVLFIIFWKLFKFSKPASLFLISILMTEFLFFGMLQDALLKIKGDSFINNSFFLLFLLGFILVILIHRIRNKRYPMINTNRFMIILFLVLIAYEIILFSITMASGKDAYSVSNRMTEPLTLTSTDTTKKPDIYYIIFDSYTNPVTLKKYWQYDNDIVPFLSSKGFFVVDSGFSNYSSTPFSISSILNLQYLKGVSPYLLSNSSNFLLGRETYLDNVLYKFLREQGYAFSIFSQLESEKMATKFGVLGVEKPVKWLRKLTLERIYLNPWMIDRFYKLVLKDQQRQPAQITESMRNFREYNDSAIHHILNSCQPGQDSKPVFNFTHIMLPHDPYQVDENGKFMPASLPGGQDMKGYLKQIKYSNTLIRQITECLLHDSSRQKIIIFQGDHGYRHYSKALKNEQFGALNAIYFHDGDYTTLTRKISHVNTYRIVLNKFFRTRLPILQDTVAMISAD